jgi:hypothetical protein
MRRTDRCVHPGSRKGHFVKKESWIENENKIVSRVKREMDQPRLTESVRNDISAQAASTVKKPLPILRDRYS